MSYFIPNDQMLKEPIVDYKDVHILYLVYRKAYVHPHTFAMPDGPLSEIKGIFFDRKTAEDCAEEPGLGIVEIKTDIISYLLGACKVVGEDLKKGLNRE